MDGTGFLGELLARIHDDPCLQAWVKPGSRPLLPFIERVGEEEACIHLLLTLPEGEGVESPWGYMAWKWPGGRLLRMLDIEEFLPSEGIPVLGRGDLCTPDAVTRIEKAFQMGQIPALPSSLAELYRRVLKTFSFPSPRKEPEQATVSSFSGSPSTQLSPPCETRAEVLASSAESPSSLEETETSLPSLCTKGGGNEEERTKGSETKGGTPERIPRRSPLLSSSESLRRLMRETRKLLERRGQRGLISEWETLYSRMNVPHFSVVVVGEFARGKSTFINTLLGREELLPTGLFSGADLRTHIGGDEEERLWRILPGGEKEPVAISELDRLVTETKEGDTQATFHLRLGDPWLRQTGIELIDTPGLNRGDAPEDTEMFKVIVTADAALIVISATMPISLTERTFIEEHLIARAVPRIAVVVTHLDQIPPAERGTLLRHLRAKLDVWAPQVPLWTAHEGEIIPAEAPFDAVGRAAIREEISQWAMDPSHQERRREQFLTQIRFLLDTLQESLEGERALLASTGQERERRIEEIRDTLRRGRLDWEDLRLALEDRREALEDWMNEELAEAEAWIRDALIADLRQSSSFRTWMEERYPLRFRSEFRRISQSLSWEIRKKIEEDTNWIAARVQEGMGRKVSAISPPKDRISPDTLTVPPRFDLPEDRLERNPWVNWLPHIVSTIAEVLHRPWMMVLSFGFEIARDKLLSSSAQEQRNKLENALSEKIRNVIHQAQRAFSRELDQIYGDILDRIHREEELWRNTMEQALDEITEGTETERRARLEQDLTAIEELRTAMVTG
ncbi:MAG: hypothetical protein D6795_18375 [Deltaproteobacteria bacterium]|nr:MAG: hypothetical protein D6795_18375 [Deltaproteobacteria bacterium]